MPAAGSGRGTSTTLAERAADYLREGPRPPLDIAREVLGLARANQAVAERLVVALLGADPRFACDVEGRWVAVPESGLGALSLAELRFAVVDVETTGLSARQGARVTEVAVVHVDGERCDVAFESLVNPEMPIPPRITELTGIDDAMVRDAPFFAEIADRLLAALNGRIFVAHNAPFDWSFVRTEMERACGVTPRLPRLCTVRLARALVPELERRDLDTVRNWFGIETDHRHRAGRAPTDDGDFRRAARTIDPRHQRHRAAGDALVTAAVLRRLLARAGEQGVATWRDLKGLAP